MSFESLNLMDSQTANGALAATLLSIGGPGLDDIPMEYKSISEGLLSDARTELNLKSDDYSPQAMQRIRARLSEEVDRRLSYGHNRQNVLNRLGSSGDLPLGAYNIRPSEAFSEEFKNEKFSFAKKCISHADMVEHIATKRGSIEGRPISLFAKRSASFSGKEHWILVLAQRVGAVLEVVALIRLFPEVIKFDGSESPLMLLKLFVDKYGINMLANGAEIANWVENETMPGRVEIVPARVSSPKVVAMVLFRFEGFHTHIRLAFAWDMGKYRSDKTRFG